MKRFTWVLASSVGLVGVACLASVPLGCVSSTNPGAPDEDAGPLPSEDSGPLPVADATVPTDSGPLDSGADVAPDSADAAPAPLTLTVLLGGAPESGVLVVFQDATGAVVSTATTDAAGSVSQLVVAGSQVTAALGTTQYPNLVTIQDVEPGDAITLVDGQSQTASFSEQVSVTLPAGPWDAATTTEYVNAGTSCGDPIAYPIYLAAYCTSGGQFPLLARAQDSTSGVETAYTYQTGNAVLTDGGNADITVTHPWATATDLATLTATSLPNVLADAGQAVGDVFLSYAEVSGGVPLALSAVTQTTGSTPSSTFNIHAGYPDFVEAEAYAEIDNGNDQEESEVFALSRSAPPTASSTTSLALGTLPAITAASLNGDDAGTPQQPTVSWTSNGPMTGANGMFVTVQWYAAPPDGGNELNGTWTIIAPPLVTSVTAPSMPSSASAFAPPSYATYNPPSVAAVEASFIAGYPGFRAQAGTIPVFSPYASGLSIPLLPANGASLYLSAIFQNED